MSERTVEDLQAGEDQTTQPGGAGWDYNPGQADYDRKFRDIASNNPDVAASGDRIAAEHRDADASRRGLQDGEKKAVGDTAVGKAAVAASAGINPALGKAVQLLGKLKTRQGATGTVVAILMVALVVGGSFLAGSLAPFAFMRNVVTDLNDQIGSLDNMQQKLLRTRLTNQLTDELIAGCQNKLTIRCKMKSISTNDAKRLATQDIEVTGGKKVGNRIFSPEGYTDLRTGKMYNAAELAEALKVGSNDGLRLRFKAGINMSALGFMGKAYKGVMERFGTNKAKPKLTGDTPEERAKNFAIGETGDKIPVDADVKPAVDADGNPTGEGIITGTDGKSTKVSAARYQAWKTTASMRVQTWFKTPIGANLLKAVSIAGAADIACTASNMIGAATVMSKVIKYRKLAAYAAPILSSITAIMAGDGTVEDGQVVGKFFNDTDNREMVEDIAASAKGYDESKAEPTMVQSKNPYYGKSVMDANLTKLSINGGAYTPTEASALYSLSLPTSLLFAVFGSILNVINSLTGPSCPFVQSWPIRGIGLVVGIVAMFFGVGEANLANNIALLVAVAVVFHVAGQYLSNLANGYNVPDDIDKKPEEKAAALWTGTSVLTASSAQRIGMIPGNKSSVQKYRKSAQQQSIKDYLAIETNNTAWYDTKSPVSLVGKVALAMNQYAPHSFTMSDVASSSKQLIAAALRQPWGETASAADDDNRLTYCQGDTDMAELGIDPDVQCNIRYVTPDTDLARDPDAVEQYMVSHGYVKADTVDGLPEGYTPPTTGDDSGIVKSITSGFVNQFYNTRDYKGNEYAKYLDACPYRIMPPGKTYAEQGAAGALGEDWASGKKCMEDSEMVSNFRSYWSLVNGVDATEIADPNATPTTATPAAPNAANPTVTSGSLPSGDAASIAQQVLPYISSDTLTCNGAQGRVCPDIQKTAAGQAIGGNCKVQALDPKLLGILLTLLKSGYKIVLSSVCSDHSADTNHVFGLSADINIINGVWIGSVGAGGYWTPGGAIDNVTRPTMQLMASVTTPPEVRFGQLQCRPPYPFLAGYRQFNDTCHHIHVDVKQ